LNRNGRHTWRFWLIYGVGVILMVGASAEWFTRHYLIARDFSYLHVVPSEFPFFRLKDNFSDEEITIRNGRREKAVRGGRSHRIAFIGDSNTFGIGSTDDRTYEERLQAAQSKYDIYNFGVPGYGLPEITAVADRIVRDNKYDYIIYNYNFNDVFVAMAGTLPLLTTAETRIPISYSFRGRLKLFLKDHWKSGVVVLHPLWLKLNGDRYRVAERESKVRSEVDGTPVLDATIAKMYRKFDDVYSDPSVVDIVKKSFLHLQKVAEANGARFLVVPHYDRPFFSRFDGTLHQKLIRILDETKVSYLDLYDQYAQHYLEHTFFHGIGDPGHLGDAGNALVAQELLTYLNRIDNPSK
jgi:hypothetical protein